MTVEHDLLAATKAEIQAHVPSGIQVELAASSEQAERMLVTVPSVMVFPATIQGEDPYSNPDARQPHVYGLEVWTVGVLTDTEDPAGLDQLSLWAAVDAALVPAAGFKPDWRYTRYQLSARQFQQDVPGGVVYASLYTTVRLEV